MVALRQRWRDVREKSERPTRSCSAVREETSLKYPARIKIHRSCRAGVLVELAGEFDVSCLVALGDALKRSSGLGQRAFVDLAGVTFVDTLCIQELVAGSDAGLLVFCRPSWQFRLAMTACGLEESVEFRVEDDPEYEAVAAEAYGCKRAGRTARRGEHHLYLHASTETHSRTSMGA